MAAACASESSCSARGEGTPEIPVAAEKKRRNTMWSSCALPCCAAAAAADGGGRAAKVPSMDPEADDEPGVGAVSMVFRVSPMVESDERRFPSAWSSKSPRRSSASPPSESAGRYAFTFREPMKASFAASAAAGGAADGKCRPLVLASRKASKLVLKKTSVEEEAG
jgi:hypothetical protein